MSRIQIPFLKDITVSGERCIMNIWNMLIVTRENVYGPWIHSEEYASQTLLNQSVGEFLEEVIQSEGVHGW